jgi:hypothetical protein
VRKLLLATLFVSAFGLAAVSQFPVRGVGAKTALNGRMPWYLQISSEREVKPKPPRGMFGHAPTPPRSGRATSKR